MKAGQGWTGTANCGEHMPRNTSSSSWDTKGMRLSMSRKNVSAIRDSVIRHVVDLEENWHAKSQGKWILNSSLSGSSGTFARHITHLQVQRACGKDQQIVASTFRSNTHMHRKQPRKQTTQGNHIVSQAQPQAPQTRDFPQFRDVNEAEGVPGIQAQEKCSSNRIGGFTLPGRAQAFSMATGTPPASASHDIDVLSCWSAGCML